MTCIQPSVAKMVQQTGLRLGSLALLGNDEQHPLTGHGWCRLCALGTIGAQQKSAAGTACDRRTVASGQAACQHLVCLAQSCPQAAGTSITALTHASSKQMTVVCKKGRHSQ